MTIPEPADQAGHRHRRGSRGGRPPAFDPTAYRQRNVVERSINRLKQWRGIATRFHKESPLLPGQPDPGQHPHLAPHLTIHQSRPSPPGPPRPRRGRRSGWRTGRRRAGRCCGAPSSRAWWRRARARPTPALPVAAFPCRAGR
ncbi:transposase, IS4 family protein [Saccharomonospora azurea SZMC 14600]|nr:transposase, IS4 family protein [Saccharomonospora azurea SZMC 14600]